MLGSVLVVKCVQAKPCKGAISAGVVEFKFTGRDGLVACEVV